MRCNIISFAVLHMLPTTTHARAHTARTPHAHRTHTHTHGSLPLSFRVFAYWACRFAEPAARFSPMCFFRPRAAYMTLCVDRPSLHMFERFPVELPFLLEVCGLREGMLRFKNKFDLFLSYFFAARYLFKSKRSHDNDTHAPA